jgi:hypothetical protein
MLHLFLLLFISFQVIAVPFNQGFINSFLVDKVMPNKVYLSLSGYLCCNLTLLFRLLETLQFDIENI